MGYLLNKLAILSFDIIAAKRGYRFVKVSSEREIDDASEIYKEEAFSFPDELKEKVTYYKKGAINFVAYYQGVVVGMVRLADPKIVNRPYELYGVDVAGDHYEIQSLVVKREHRDGSQFVMLGLFKAMYIYSVRHDVISWSSCSARSVYLTIRRFCKKIEIEQLDFRNIDNPLTQYLFENKIIDTYYTMEVADFVPWAILKKLVKQMSKKWEMPEFIKIKKLAYEGFNYRGK